MIFWQKWLVIGLAFAAMAAVIGFERIQIANGKAEISRLGAEVVKANTEIEQARATVQTADDVNARLAKSNSDLRREADAAIAAITKDRDRLVIEASQVKLVREKIHASALACVGEPPAYGDAFSWVRNTRPESR